MAMAMAMAMDLEMQTWLGIEMVAEQWGWINDDEEMAVELVM